MRWYDNDEQVGVIYVEADEGADLPPAVAAWVAAQGASADLPGDLATELIAALDSAPQWVTSAGVTVRYDRDEDAIDLTPPAGTVRTWDQLQGAIGALSYPIEARGLRAIGPLTAAQTAAVAVLTNRGGDVVVHTRTGAYLVLEVDTIGADLLIRQLDPELFQLLYQPTPEV